MQIIAEINGIRIQVQYVDNDLFLFLPAFEGNTIYLTGNVALYDRTAQNVVVLQDEVKIAINLDQILGEECLPGLQYTIDLCDLDGNRSGELFVIRADNISTIAVELPDSMSVNDLHLPGKPAIKNGKIAMITEDGVSIITNDATDSVYSDLKKISGRGNSTWIYSGDKRPYTITLEEKASLIDGAPESKKWCLLTDNCNGDWVHEGAGLANYITYQLYEHLDTLYSVSSEPVNLYINGEYRGIYLLTNKVELGSSLIDIPKFENEEDKTGKTQIMSSKRSKTWGTQLIDDTDPAIAAGIQLYQYATNSKGVDNEGGYLIEMDEKAPYKDTCYFVTSHNHTYAVCSPEFGTREQIQAIALFIEEYEQALYSPDGVNDLGFYYADYLDIRAMAQKAIIDMISVQTDQFRRSCYFYTEVHNGTFTDLVAGPAWDYDGVNYGSVENGAMEYIDALMQHGDFVATINDVSQSDLKNVWESMIQKLPEIIEVMSTSQKMSSILWNAKENRTEKSGGRSTADYAADYETFANNFQSRYQLWYQKYWDEGQLSGASAQGDGLQAIFVGSDLFLNTDEVTWYKVGSSTPVGYGTYFVPTEIGAYYCAISGNTVGYASERTLYSNPVKAGYRVLDYIESNGENYLELDYIPTNTTSITFEGDILSDDAAIIGGGSAIGAKDMFSLTYENNSELVFFNRHSEIGDKISSGENHIIKIWREKDRGHLKLDYLKNQSVKI